MALLSVALLSVAVLSVADLSAALIGYGLAGAVFHAPLMAATAGIRIAAIVTADRERQARAARDHPGATIVDRAERLWDRAADFDVVVIASPNRTHVPFAMAALDAGLAVVVDKPMAPTAEEARRLAAEAHRRGLLLTVFQNRRWDGDFLTVRRLLAAEELGDVFRFESRFERWRPAPRGGWRESGEPAEAGGLLYDLGSHLIDQSLVLFGAVTQVYAELDRRRPAAQVEDDAFVALTHASGVRAHLSMTALAAEPAARFRVLGTRATYTKLGLDVQEEALRGGARPSDLGFGEEPMDRWGTLCAGETVRRVRTEPGAYVRFYEALVASLRSGAAPPVDPAGAIQVLEIIEAGRKSAAAGETVPLPSAPDSSISSS